MKPRERIDDLKDGILAALEGWQKGIWTCLPCVITGFDPSDMTVSCVSAIQMQQKLESGALQWITVTELRKVPVKFPSGGDYILTFPLAAGDECVVNFSSRCFDAWWQSGAPIVNGVVQAQPQSEFRMHDLSDGFAEVGIFSRPNVVSGISLNSTQLRHKDGESFVEVAAGVVTIKAASIILEGNITSTGTLTNNGKDISSTHKHGLVTTGTDDSGVPI